MVATALERPAPAFCRLQGFAYSFRQSLFLLAENGQLTTLHAFTGGSDGAAPNGGLLIGKSGTLYGTTQAGGDTSCYTQQASGCGVVFKLTP